MKHDWSTLNAISGLLGTALVGVGLALACSPGVGLMAAGGCFVLDSFLTKLLLLRRR